MLFLIKRKVKATALFYALLIATVVAILITALLSLLFLNQSILNQGQIQSRLERNLDSGIAILLAAEQRDTGTFVVDLYGEEIDTVILNRRHWGLFDIVSSEAVFQNNAIKKMALIGQSINSKDNQALTLIGGNKALVLSGNTRILGNAKVPKAGVKKGSTNGKRYTGKKLIYGHQSTGLSQLPLLNTNRLKRNAKLQKTRTTFRFNELEDRIFVAFSEETLYIRDSVLDIRGKTLIGNICLIADSLAIIRKNSQLEDVLIYAPSVEIESNVSGQMQIFASESIKIGKNVRFLYPSVLSLLIDKKQEDALLYLDQNFYLEGLILLHRFHQYATLPKMYCQGNSLINGEIFSDGTIDFKGQVLGNITCPNFSLRIGLKQYFNHLLDVTIAPKKRYKAYVAPYFRKEKGKSSIVKWLD